MEFSWINLSKVSCKKTEKKRKIDWLFNTIQQWFTTFFGSWHPYIVINIFGRTPGWFIRCKDLRIVTIGCTHNTNSRHLCVTRTPVGNHCTVIVCSFWSGQRKVMLNEKNKHFTDAVIEHMLPVKKSIKYHWTHLKTLAMMCHTHHTKKAMSIVLSLFLLADMVFLDLNCPVQCRSRLIREYVWYLVLNIYNMKTFWKLDGRLV